jgi:hypothetical protein
LNRRPKIIPKSREGIGQIAVEHRLTASELPPLQLLDLTGKFGSFHSVIALHCGGLDELVIHKRGESGAAGERIDCIIPNLGFDLFQPNAAFSAATLSGHRMGPTAFVVWISMRIAAAESGATTSAAQNAGEQICLRGPAADAFPICGKRLLRVFKCGGIDDRRNSDFDPLRFRASLGTGPLALAGSRRFASPRGFRRDSFVPGKPTSMICVSAGDLKNCAANPSVARRRGDALIIQRFGNLAARLPFDDPSEDGPNDLDSVWMWNQQTVLGRRIAVGRAIVDLSLFRPLT